MQSCGYLRHRDEVEVVEPGEDGQVEAIIGSMRNVMRSTPDQHPRAFRGTHAENHGS